MYKNIKVFKRILIFMLALTIMGIKPINVDAMGLKAGAWLSYHVKHVKGNYIRRAQFQVLYNDSNNEWVYCVQPMVDLNESGKYEVTSSNIASVFNLSPDVWNYVAKLAYYGYGYNNHLDEKWYVATQMLIWNGVNDGSRSYFTSNGEEDDSVLLNEMNEIKALVNNHDILPSFYDIPSNILLKSNINLIDRNGVLKDYKVDNVVNGKASINGNTLSLSPSSSGTLTIKLKKNSDYYHHPIKAYYGSISQSAFAKGDISSPEMTLNLRAIGVKVAVTKSDAETGIKPQGDAEFKGAKFRVNKDFNNGEYITTLTTDENGYAISDYLDRLGTYCLTEITSPKGYLNDMDYKCIKIDGQSLINNVEFNDKVIKNKITILKQYKDVNGETTFLNPEANVTFDVYNRENIKVASFMTDVNGYGSVILPYGNYRIHQVTSINGYAKINDWSVEVNETSNSNQQYNILDNSLSSYLKIIKIDQETGQIILLKNTSFKIYNKDTKEYVTQFVGGKKYDTFYTDDNGIATTYLKLSMGHYQLKEISAPAGYLLNNLALDFSIDDQTSYINSPYGLFTELKFLDMPIKGQIKVNKQGEDLVINNGKYYYVNNALAGVEFNIYAYNDIYSSDKTYKYYSKDQLVSTLKTDKNGYAISNELPLGKYYLVEISAPHNYVIDKDLHVLTLNEVNDKEPIVYASYMALNRLKKGTLEFIKEDNNTHKVLPGAIIKIYTEDNKLIYTGITNNEGKIILNNLSIGKYYIIESQAPDGYNLNNLKTYFTISANEEHIKSVMEDTPIIVPKTFISEPIPNQEKEIDVPNTSTYDIIIYLGISLIIVGLIIIIYEKSKK